MNDILSSSEFWTGFAFVLVVGLFMRPLLRGMSKWTDKRVNLIQKEQNEAREVLKKAEEMKKKYEKAYLNRFSEKQQMMQEADNEISALDEEMHILTTDRINHKKQEIELRLKMIEENGRQDIKTKMLNQILSDTRRYLKKQETSENAEDVLQNAFSVLEEQGKHLSGM